MTAIAIKSVLDVTPELIAEMFCEIDDEQQAQFFIEVERISRRWPKHVYGENGQWWLVGKHLRTCECSNEETRNIVRAIACGIEVEP